MKKINYSFVIPHHNRPELLNRLLDTIPEREDIQIIVVDDNSDDDKKPAINRNGVQLIYIDKEHTKGAGKARNVGMEEAKGEWLLFADSDDIYEKGFVDILDKYRCHNIDILCFDMYFHYDLKTQTERWTNTYSNAVKKYLSCKPNQYWLRMVKHSNDGPTNFMVRLDFVKKIGVKFGETITGEDAVFHHITFMNTDRVEVISDKLYYYLWNEDSLVHNVIPKRTIIELIENQKYIINLLIKANAYGTISPLTRGIGRLYRSYGCVFTIYFKFRQLTCGIPWLKIWWHQLTDKKV